MQHHQCGPFFYLTRELRIARANASVTVLNEFISALQEVSQNPSLCNNHKAFQKNQLSQGQGQLLKETSD